MESCGTTDERATRPKMPSAAPMASCPKPKDHFPNSIMNLSNTAGAGRGSDKGSVIGDVINHGKKKYWVKGGNHHYHLGLEAGENTLEA